MNQCRDLVTPCRRYALHLAAASWQQIDSECRRSGAIETGGILVGHYSTDASTVIVTEALPPPKDSTRGRSWFHRGVAGLRELLTNRWQSKVRSYYIGEWHYHPASIVEPSKDDLTQMYSINADRRYSCREPVMLIVGQPQAGVERPLRAFVFPQGQLHMELEESSSEG
jgi:integrative and conjugative element protein (TIGR02256 family)